MQKIQIKPLSVNKAWKGRRFPSEEYKEYTQEVLMRLRFIEVPKKTRLTLIIWSGVSSNSSDASNLIKLFEDILCKKFGHDDRWHYSVVVHKKIVPKGKEYIAFDIHQQTQEEIAICDLMI